MSTFSRHHRFREAGEDANVVNVERYGEPKRSLFTSTKVLSFRHEIDITDATCIQRSCAMMQTRIDERILLHGDIDGDGLSVMDATMIQRHLLGATLPYPVGVWRQEEK